MEPLSIATGVFACLTLVEQVAKCSKSLYRSARRINGAKNDITKFANHVNLFGCLIGAACTALEPYCNVSENKSPPVLQYLLKNQVLDSLVEESESVKDEICHLVPLLRGLRGAAKWKVVLKWVYQKKDIEAMVPKMESVKCSFQLVMHSIVLEAFRLQPRTKEGDREMEVYSRQQMYRLC